MSAKKELFKELGTYLMEVLQTTSELTPNGIIPPELNLKGLQWFDKQMGQFDTPEASYTLPLPCILMQYQPGTWYTIGKNQQRWTGNIRFWIYFENYADAFTGSINQDLALQFFDFSEYVNIALQGYFSSNCPTPLDRVGDNEDSAEDMIVTSQVDYSTILIESATSDDRRFVAADPDVKVERVKNTSRPDRRNFTDGFVIKHQ